jgi:hypothetical protein
MNTTISIAVAIAIAVGGVGGYAAARVTTAAAICIQQPKADGLNDAERRFLDVPDQPTTGHKRFP